MTTDDLARLRSLAEAAGNPDDWWLKQAHRVSPEQAVANAAYIAALDPQTVLALLDAAEASERLRTAAQRVIDHWYHDPDCKPEGPTAHIWIYVDNLQRVLRQTATPPPATVDER